MHASQEGAIFSVFCIFRLNHKRFDIFQHHLHCVCWTTILPMMDYHFKYDILSSYLRNDIMPGILRLVRS